MNLIMVIALSSAWLHAAVAPYQSLGEKSGGFSRGVKERGQVLRFLWFYDVFFVEEVLLIGVFWGWDEVLFRFLDIRKWLVCWV